jgi:predicted DNA-binding protein (UPF0251 family)
MPRPPSVKIVRHTPRARRFGPYDQPPGGRELLTREGLEAIRLFDLEGLDQQTAAELMGVSRPTFGRVLAAARLALARAVVEGRELVIEGGVYREAGPGWGRRRRRHRGRRGRGM